MDCDVNVSTLANTDESIMIHLDVQPKEEGGHHPQSQ